MARVWLRAMTAALLTLPMPAINGQAEEAKAPTREEFDTLRARLDAVEKSEREMRDTFQERSEAGKDDGHRMPHIHGYGEVHYNRPRTGTMDADEPARADFHRMVIGLDHDFTDTIGFDMEIDFEHAANANDLELEYA